MWPSLQPKPHPYLGHLLDNISKIWPFLSAWRVDLLLELFSTPSANSKFCQGIIFPACCLKQDHSPFSTLQLEPQSHAEEPFPVPEGPSPSAMAEPLSLNVGNGNFPSTYCCLAASASIFCVFLPFSLQSLSNTRQG